MQVAVAQDRVVVAVAPGRGDGSLAVALARLPAVDAVPAAVGDVAKLLDVDVDQLTGPVPLIAADRHAGRTVQVRQPRAAVTGQDSMHRRGRQAQPEADPGWAQPPADPQADDPVLGAPRGPGRAGPGPGRPVRHPRSTQLPVPGC